MKIFKRRRRLFNFIRALFFFCNNSKRNSIETLKIRISLNLTLQISIKYFLSSLYSILHLIASKWKVIKTQKKSGKIDYTWQHHSAGRVAPIDTNGVKLFRCLIVCFDKKRNVKSLSWALVPYINLTSNRFVCDKATFKNSRSLLIVFVFL